MTADELVRAADESFIASFRKLAQHVPEGETHEGGSIFSFVTGLPLSGFNGCVATQEASSDEFAVALAWVAARDVPYRVWVAEKLAARLAEVPSSYALAPAAALYPGMVLHPIPDTLALSPGVSVVSILESSLEEFIGVLEESGLRHELAVRLISSRSAGRSPRHENRLPHPLAGSVPQVRAPLRFSGSPLSYAAAPPLLGQHSRDVLRDTLGIGDAAFADLVQRGVVGVPAPDAQSNADTPPAMEIRHDRHHPHARLLDHVRDRVARRARRRRAALSARDPDRQPRHQDLARRGDRRGSHARDATCTSRPKARASSRASRTTRRRRTTSSSKAAASRRSRR